MMSTNTIAKLYISLALAIFLGFSFYGCSDSSKKKNTGSGTASNTTEIYYSRVDNAGAMSWQVKSISIQDNADYLCGWTGNPTPPPYMPGQGTLTTVEFDNAVSVLVAADFFNLSNSYSSGGPGTVSYTIRFQYGGQEKTIVAPEGSSAPLEFWDAVTHLHALMNAKW